jgi:hypothetical protein
MEDKDGEQDGGGSKESMSRSGVAERAAGKKVSYGG